MKQSLYEKLNTVRRIKKRIAELLAMRDSLLNGLIPSGISYDKDKVMTSPEDLLSKTMAEVACIESDIVKLDAFIPNAKAEVEKVISKLANTTERVVLTYIYIGDMDKNYIADILGYDRTAVYKIHDRAIEELEKKF